MFGLHRRVRIAYPAFRKNDLSSIFGVFFKGALREAYGTRFFVILSDFEISGDDHLGSKRRQKKRLKKRL